MRRQSVIVSRKWLRFKEMAEGELLSLHEGNFARYLIRPSEFSAWQAIWAGEAAP